MPVMRSAVPKRCSLKGAVLGAPVISRVVQLDGSMCWGPQADLMSCRILNLAALGFPQCDHSVELSMSWETSTHVLCGHKCPTGF